MAALVQQLDTYSKVGIPTPSSMDTLALTPSSPSPPPFDELGALYSLEEDWTDVVGAARAKAMGERQRAQQTAIWEMVTTEVAYIRTIRVIQDVSQLTITCCMKIYTILARISFGL